MFWEYFIEIDKFIDSNWRIKNRRVIVIIDRVIHIQQYKFGAIFFLSQYSPHYALVESFSPCWRATYAWNSKENTKLIHSEATLVTIEKIIKGIKDNKYSIYGITILIRSSKRINHSHRRSTIKLKRYNFEVSL